MAASPLSSRLGCAVLLRQVGVRDSFSLYFHFLCLSLQLETMFCLCLLILGKEEVLRETLAMLLYLSLPAPAALWLHPYASLCLSTYQALPALLLFWAAQRERRQRLANTHAGMPMTYLPRAATRCAGAPMPWRLYACCALSCRQRRLRESGVCLRHFWACAGYFLARATLPHCLQASHSTTTPTYYTTTCLLFLDLRGAGACLLTHSSAGVDALRHTPALCTSKGRLAPPSISCLCQLATFSLSIWDGTGQAGSMRTNAGMGSTGKTCTWQRTGGNRRKRERGILLSAAWMPSLLRCAAVLTL